MRYKCSSQIFELIDIFTTWCRIENVDTFMPHPSTLHVRLLLLFLVKQHRLTKAILHTPSSYNVIFNAIFPHLQQKMTRWKATVFLGPLISLLMQYLLSLLFNSSLSLGCRWGVLHIRVVTAFYVSLRLNIADYSHTHN